MTIIGVDIVWTCT